jgi:hypothetical protein
MSDGGDTDAPGPAAHVGRARGGRYAARSSRLTPTQNDSDSSFDPDPTWFGPRWLLGPVLAVTTAIAVALPVLLLLAVVGWMRPLIALPAVAAALVGVGWRLRRAIRPELRLVRGSLWGAALLALVAVVGAMNLRGAGQHVVVDRDPAVYVTTALLVADTGGLVADAEVGPFATSDAVRGDSSLGWFTYDDGRTVSPQFVHGLPVLAAFVDDVVPGRPGWAIFHLNAFITALSMIMVFAVARRWMPPWCAALAAALLALSPATMFLARDLYSEPLTQLLLFGALAMMLVDRDHGWPAGVLLGALACVRVDVPLIGLGLLVWVLVSSRSSRWLVRLGLGAVPGIVVAWIDLGVRSRTYVSEHATQTIGLWLVMGVVAAAVMAARRFGVDRRLAHLHIGHRMSTAFGGSVVAIGFAAWFLRDRVQTVRETNGTCYSIAALQQGLGEPVDPTRRYFEHSVTWLSWFVGWPALAAAIVVAGFAAAAVLRHGSVRQHDLGGDLGLLLACCVPTSVLYLTLVQTAPDQLWVSRRFIVTCIPLVCLGAGVAVARIRPRIVAPLAAIMMLMVVVDLVRPLTSMAPREGQLQLVDQVCDDLGPDAAVIAFGSAFGDLQPVLRSRCNLPAVLPVMSDTDETAACTGTPAASVAMIDRAEAERLAAAWAAEGRTLWISGSEADIRRLTDEPIRTYTRINPNEPAQSLTRPLDSLFAAQYDLKFAPVR